MHGPGQLTGHAEECISRSFDQNPDAAPEQAPDWPCLPRQGFVAGRPAVLSDISNGDAVFTAVVNERVVGKPLGITVPQYAYLRTTAQRGVLVQAEEVRGMRAFGFRALDGDALIATEAELELLGTVKPG